MFHKAVTYLSCSAVSAAAARKQQRLEGAPEVDVEHSVYDRVESGVDVAEPDDKRDETLPDRLGAGGAAERKQDVHNEERKPADDECCHNNGHCSSNAPLPVSYTHLTLPTIYSV